MIGMLSGNTKVFSHKEINNHLWQKMIYKEEYSYRDTKAMLLDASNGQNINLSELYELMTGKKVFPLKKENEEDREEKFRNNKRRKRTNYQEDSLYLRR